MEQIRKHLVATRNLAEKAYAGCEESAQTLYSMVGGVRSVKAYQGMFVGLDLAVRAIGDHECPPRKEPTMRKMINQSKIENLAPTFIARRNGIDYYEHPTRGDEAPLIAKVDGVWHITDEWDLPDEEGDNHESR